MTSHATIFIISREVIFCLIRFSQPTENTLSDLKLSDIPLLCHVPYYIDLIALLYAGAFAAPASLYCPLAKTSVHNL